MATDQTAPDFFPSSSVQSLDKMFEDAQALIEDHATAQYKLDLLSMRDFKALATVYTAIGYERNKLRRRYGLQPLKGAPTWVLWAQMKRKP